MHRSARRKLDAGFSLLELLAAVAIFSLIMGVVFANMSGVQKRFRVEESKLEVAQSSREFVDQLVRDLHQAGYPNARMFQAGLLTVPVENDIRNAVGLVRYTPTNLVFEGDMDQDGNVDSVRYTFQAGPDGRCPCVLRRSQVPKVAGSPLAQPTNFTLALDNLLNSGGTLNVGGTSSFRDAQGNLMVWTNDALYANYRAAPIFTAFDRDGNVVGSVDITNPDVLATIRTIRVTVNVLSRMAEIQTGVRPAVSMTATAQINN